MVPIFDFILLEWIFFHYLLIDGLAHKVYNREIGIELSCSGIVAELRLPHIPN